MCAYLCNCTLYELKVYESVWYCVRYLQLLFLVLQRAFELHDAPLFFLHRSVPLCLTLLQSCFFSLKLRASFLKGTAQVLQHRDDRLHMLHNSFFKTYFKCLVYSHSHIRKHTNLVVFFSDLPVLQCLL